MKNGILMTISALLLMTWAASAQVTTSGNFIVGSTLGFSHANSKITQDSGSGGEAEANPSSTQFSIAPSIGYFVVDNLALGIRMDYTLSRVDREQPLTDGDADRTVDSDLLFGPFTRFYLPVEDDMAFFFEAGFGFGNSNDEQEIGGQRQSINTNLFAVGIGPGLTIVSDQAIGIEAIVKYNFARSDFDTEIGGIKASTVTRTNQFDFSIGIQFYFTAIQKATAEQPPRRF